jgi:NADPH:quinone reductase-like Zn-dependent oxidoreductase
MKAIVYEKHARQGTLTLHEVAKPIPGAGEVLVRIGCASLNALDYRSIRMGALPKSRILGADIAGVVEAVGEGSSLFAMGDAVLGDLSGCGMGGFAEYAAVPERVLARKPAHITFAQAAALPVAAVTALQAIRNKGCIQSGQQVLICGASGGVGTYAIQLARLFGAEVTALCSQKNIAQTLSLGIEHALDYRAFDFTREQERFDVIIAINGNHPLTAYLRLLRHRGRLVVVGGALSQVFRAMLLGPFLSISARKVSLLAAKPNADDLALVADLVSQGKITPVIDRQYPLAQTGEALLYLEEEHSCGKVLITIAESAKVPENENVHDKACSTDISA